MCNILHLQEIYLQNFFYDFEPGAKKLLDEVGDLSSRVNLRRNLKCKSFKWSSLRYLRLIHIKLIYFNRFLDKVYPEKSIPNSGQREFSDFFMEYPKVEVMRSGLVSTKISDVMNIV